MPDVNPDLLPVELDPNTNSFEAAGYTYHIERSGTLTVERSIWLERFGTYSLLGRDGMSFIKEVRRAYDLNNQSKPGDVAVVLDNVLKAAADLMAKESPLLYVCTLFINRTDEDRGEYNLELAKQKIEDFKKSRISADFFLALALSYLSVTGNQLSTLMQTYSVLSLASPTLSD